MGAFVGDTVTLLTPQGTLVADGHGAAAAPIQRRRNVPAWACWSSIRRMDSSRSTSAGRMIGSRSRDHLELRGTGYLRSPEDCRRHHRTLGSEYLTQDWSA